MLFVAAFHAFWLDLQHCYWRCKIYYPISFKWAQLLMLNIDVVAFLCAVVAQRFFSSIRINSFSLSLSHYHSGSVVVIMLMQV